MQPISPAARSNDPARTVAAVSEELEAAGRIGQSRVRRAEDHGLGMKPTIVSGAGMMVSVLPVKWIVQSLLAASVHWVMASFKDGNGRRKQGRDEFDAI